MSKDKPFKTNAELIELLKSRGISIKDEEYANKILFKVGYYNLINGYNKLFIDQEKSKASDQIYKQGTTLKEIHTIYEFDRILREIFLRYILKVETHIKSLIAYYFSQQYGHNQYLLYNNFDTTAKDSYNRIPALIADIQKQIAAYSNEPSISHYLHTYGYVPLWVLNNVLTFGTISKFYSLMKISEKEAVAKQFKIPHNELKTIIQYLSAVRNFCAHNNRIYCYNSKRPLVDTIYHDSLGIVKSTDTKYKTEEFVQGKRDLFGAVLALRCLLSNNDFNKFMRDLSKALSWLKDNLNVLTLNDVLNEMGFPRNWTDLSPLSQKHRSRKKKKKRTN